MVKGDDISLRVFEYACRAVTGESRESMADMDPASFFDALVTIEAFSDAFNAGFYAMG